jgi:excisionase family DNA binding protein
MVLTVPQVAQQLGLHPSRVRRLIAGGDLAASKVGRDWLIDEPSVDRLRTADRPRGRPIAPAHAWAILWLASGDAHLQAMAADWLEPWAASRLRRALDDGSWRLRLPLLRRRAQIALFRIRASEASQFLADPRLVATGTSASHIYGFGSQLTGLVEAYVAAEHLESVRADFRLAEGGRQPNVVLHVVGEPWPFPESTRLAPAIAVAADLAEADEPHRRAAALAYLARRLGTYAPPG